MAKLVLVGDETRLVGNKLDEIIDIFEDDKELGNIVDQQILDGLFKVVIVPDTVEQVRLKMKDSQPEIMYCWRDKDTGEIKHLEKRPQYSVKYNSGNFESTLILAEENHVLANQSVKDELVAIKDELVAKEISLDCMVAVELVKEPIIEETLPKGL